MHIWFAQCCSSCYTETNLQFYGRRVRNITPITFYMPCLFGLEGLVGEELRRLHMSDVRVENGHVLCRGTIADIARLNLNLRCAERVLIQLGSFSAASFDALFEQTKALPWEDWIPEDGAFPVKGFSLESTLHSVPDCQRIIKKAVAVRLAQKYGTGQLPETGAEYQIQFAILQDRASLMLDTSGAGLHKRGYRAVGVRAPLRETLAAAMVTLSRYRGKDPFCDPFCGSGTIAIEAALIAKNRAPGLDRSFSAQKWRCVPGESWMDAADETMDQEYDGAYDIWGGDIDPKAIAIARSNAEKAGVEDCIRFEVADAVKFRRDSTYGQLVTNPPYGERLLETDTAGQLYRAFGQTAAKLPEKWRVYILSSHPEFEKCYGSLAAKKRKLYNGMIQCYLYMYYR